MGRLVKTIKVRGGTFTADKARRLAARIQELPESEVVVDLGEAGRIEPDALPLLAALFKARKNSLSGVSFEAEEAVAAALAEAIG